MLTHGVMERERGGGARVNKLARGTIQGTVGSYYVKNLFPPKEEYGFA